MFHFKFFFITGVAVVLVQLFCVCALVIALIAPSLAEQQKKGKHILEHVSIQASCE